MGEKNRDLKILGLSGSYGTDSSNSKLVSLALKKAEELGVSTVFWNLSEKPLPLVGSEGSWDDIVVKEFQELAESCDGYILSSPEYHGSMSGVMKNQLDWIYSKHVSGKPFGLMSTLGGQSNSNTLNHLRICVRWIHGWAIPEQLAVAHIKKAFNEEGHLVDDEINERLDGLVEKLVSTLRLFNN